MLQQLVLELRLLTSSRVSLVRPLLAVGVADFDDETLCVGLCEGVGVALADGLTDALGVVFMTAPLFQMSLVPDLTQKCLMFPTILVAPTLVHLVPVIVAACEGIVNAARNTAVSSKLEYALNFMS